MRDSVLQREPRLAELIDPVGFQEVCEAFAGHFHAGLRVLDTAGKKVVDIRGPRVLCDLIHRTPGGKARHTPGGQSHRCSGTDNHGGIPAHTLDNRC